MMPEPLYMLLYVEGRGSEDLELKKAEAFLSKGRCEVALEKMLKDARTHGNLVPGGVRFSGACVLMEEA